MFTLDIFGNPEPLSIYVTRVDGSILGCIDDIIDETSASLTIGLNQQYSLEFTTISQNDDSWYSYLHEGMYLLVKDVGLFKMNQPTISSDGEKETKTINAFSCDSELEDKTTSLQINIGLKTSQEYLVKYEDGETETLINPYTGIPYDWIVLYNTFPEQLTAFKELLDSGHFGTKDSDNCIVVTDDSLISELSEMFKLIPRLLNKVEIVENEGEEESVLKEYAITTYDTEDPERVVQYDLLSEFGSRVSTLISYYTKYRSQLSLLDIVLENTGGGWTVGDIYGLSNGDNSICNMKYQFDINESLYSFLTNTFAQTTNCLVSFDLFHRKVNVTPIEQVGNDTGIIMGYDTLVNTLNIETDEDRLSTRLSISGGDDLNIARVNFGSNYVDDIRYKLNAVNESGNRIYVSDEFAQKYMDYIDYREQQRESFIELSKEYASYQEQISELENRVPNDNLKNDWSTFSMEELEASLKQFKVLLATLESLYKEDYGTAGLNDDGSIKESFIKDTEYWYDYIAYKEIIEEIKCAIDVFPYYNDSSKWTDEQVAEYKDKIKAWETEWSLYGIKELQAKVDTYKQNMDILLANQNDSGKYDEAKSAVILKPDGSDYEIKTWDELTTDEKAQYGSSELLYRYDIYNESYTNWVSATEYLNGLLEQKKDLESSLEQAQEDREAITKNVSLENNFTEDECKVIYRLYRDGEYSNDNILSTSIDSSSEHIDRMVELLEDAQDEASIVSRPQLQFSIEADNLLVVTDFQPFWNDFYPGNYILVQYRDNTYVKLRMLSYTFNPCLPSSSNFDIVFSNFVRSRAYYRDWASIFGTSSSSATSSYGSSGGGSGTGDYGESDDIDITISNTMLAKLLNTEMFGSRVTNVILDTVDVNALTTRLATFEGLTSGTTTIDGKCITTGYIKSDDYDGDDGAINNGVGTVINLDNDTFSFAGGKILYDGSTLNIYSDNMYIGSEAALTSDDVAGKLDTSSDDGSILWNGSTLSIQSGSLGAFYAVEIGGNGIDFKYNDEKVAGIDQDKLAINKTIVLDEMQVGENNNESEWTWKYDNKDRSLYLKWIGR